MVTRSLKCVDGYGSSNLNSESEFSYCSSQASGDIFLSSFFVVVVVVGGGGGGGGDVVVVVVVVFSSDVCSV